MNVLRRLAFVLVLVPWGIAHAAPAAPGQAAIATAHPVATAAGRDVIEAGGNAFDAAVAITAALAVVEPYGSGLGGGGFYLLHEAKSGRDVMLDARERAPGEATRDMYLDDEGEPQPDLSVDGPLAAGIPGIPAALDHLAGDYGALPLTKTLDPAIRAARDGFEVTETYRRLAGFREELLADDPGSRSTFLDDGKLPEIGHVIRQPDLADTLKRIAVEGRDGFYRGELGGKLVDGVREVGGIWSRSDLADYRVVEREPVVSRFRGFEVVAAAPPSSGGVAIAQILNIYRALEDRGGELDDLSVLGMHYRVEAMRRAYRDRAEYLGDPDYVDMPLDRLTSDDYAAGLAVGISPTDATSSASLAPVVTGPEGPHTTHFSVIDAEGNYVAATLSINYPFGAGVTVPGTGVLLNDEMDDFSQKPGEPNVYGLVGAEANAIAPGKRPLSSMSPTFVRSDELVGVLGTPGGSRIITMVLGGVLAATRGEPVDEWVAEPRIHHQYLPDRIEVEPDLLTDEQRAELELMGHRVEEKDNLGNMQAVGWWRGDNRLEAASDPRGEGEASVFAPKGNAVRFDGIAGSRVCSLFWRRTEVGLARRGTALLRADKPASPVWVNRDRSDLASLRSPVNAEPRGAGTGLQGPNCGVAGFVHEPRPSGRLAPAGSASCRSGSALVKGDGPSRRTAPCIWTLGGLAEASSNRTAFPEAP